MMHIQPQVEFNFNSKFNQGLLPVVASQSHAIAMTKAKIKSLLGSRIDARLEELERNASWLAGEMGVSDETVSKWRNGKSDPGYSKLPKLAQTLKCPAGYLLGDEQSFYRAEVVRLMSELDDDGEQQILTGVKMMAFTLPKKSHQKQRA